MLAPGTTSNQPNPFPSFNFTAVVEQSALEEKQTIFACLTTEEMKIMCGPSNNFVIGSVILMPLLLLAIGSRMGASLIGELYQLHSGRVQGVTFHPLNS